jgi:signal transduction histidine kinase
MEDNDPDFTQKLISESSLRNHLTSIFVDSIILKNGFRIALVSKRILEILGFEMSELYDSDISTLTVNNSFGKELERELARGFFDQLQISLKTKRGQIISFNISGFYLGLISDLNGYVVLTIKALNTTDYLNHSLEESRKELDEFIYRAAHDLRGPLATIRGLANIMKLEKDANQMIQLIGMLEKHAEKLDDRLFKLLYLAETGQSDGSNDSIDFDVLETSLRATLEESMGVDYADFHFEHGGGHVEGIHGQLVISMLNNILLYLITLPKTATNELVFSVMRHKIGIQFTIHSQGFIGNHEIRQAINQTGSVYSNMLTYTHLINYYAAQKIARKINASIQINFIRDQDQHISIFIPFIFANGSASYTGTSAS